jgi:hypothetical protein
MTASDKRAMVAPASAWVQCMGSAECQVPSTGQPEPCSRPPKARGEITAWHHCEITPQPGYGSHAVLPYLLRCPWAWTTRMHTPHPGHFRQLHLVRASRLRGAWCRPSGVAVGWALSDVTVA